MKQKKIEENWKILSEAWKTLAKERGVTEEDVDKWIEEYRSTVTPRSWQERVSDSLKLGTYF